MQHPTVFLDRDGTINYDTGYIKDANLVRLYPGVAEGIKKLKDQYNFKIVVISNQAGIAYGILTHEDVKSINNKINNLLLEFGTSIDNFYYCPFHPEFNSEEESNCRKPSPYMIVKASKDLNLDLKRSYMIGDKHIDILCGINAGVKSILINYSGEDTEINILHNLEKKPNFVAANFTEVCDFIIKDYLEVCS
ncbi:MAG: HAD family hydrolase [Bacteroidota bacterium]